MGNDAAERHDRELTRFDRLLQRLRIERAARYIGHGDRVLDVGTADGALFTRLTWIDEGLGIDPAPGSSPRPGIALRTGYFPEALGASERFDVVTALAVLEHIPSEGQDAFAKGCRTALVPGGLVVITVPAPLVDHLLKVLIRLRLLKGMEAEEHWGFRPSTTTELFTSAGFTQHAHRRFELGLNHLFVFQAHE